VNTKLSSAFMLSCDWREVARRLTLFAFRRLGRGAQQSDAEELAQEALRRFLDPNYAGWDRSVEPDLLRHLGSIVNGLVSNRVQRAKRRQDVTLDNADLVAHENSDSRLVAADHVRHLVLRIRAALEDDPQAERVFELMLDGVDRPAEQATELGIPASDLYKIRRRLLAAIENIQMNLELDHRQ
jgi:hypothetical protein